MSSNYPNGFANGIVIRDVPLIQTHPGRALWVYNGTLLDVGHKNGSNGNRGTFSEPYATLEYAISQCRANKGDIIFVKPGHAETINNNTVLTLDRAGIAIVGLGQGSMRPTLTFSTANTANIPVTANNITMYNFLFVANFLAIASVFTLTAAADFIVDSCEFRDNSSVLNFVSIVTTVVSTNNDGLTFTNNKVFGLGTTAATTPIKVASTHSRLSISDNTVILAVLNNTSGLLAHGALVVTNLEMFRNKVFRLNTDTATGAMLITTSSTTNTGIVANNFVQSRHASGNLLVTAGSVYGMHENYVSGNTNTSGVLGPVASAL